MLKRYGFLLFALLTLLHLFSILLAWEQVRFLTKPLLMPLLAVGVQNSVLPGKGKNLVMAGIFFSFAGDTFLLFDHVNPLYFIAGLASFLVTHILYTVYFLRISPTAPSLLKKHPWIVLAIIAYGLGLLYLLFPGLESLRLPVSVYAVIICSMLLCSIHIYKRLKKPAGNMLVTGALLFVVSDSLLAIAKFYHSFAAASFLIMLTYCAAQYCIAKGLVKANDWKRPSAL